MPRYTVAIRHAMWDRKTLTLERDIFVNPFPIQVLFVFELLGRHSGFRLLVTSVGLTEVF